MCAKASVMSWTAIWDHSGPVFARNGAKPDLEAATFLLEGRGLSASGDGVLWSAAPCDGTGLYIATDGDGRVNLRHRDMRVSSAAGAITPGDAYRLTYRRTRAGGAGVLELNNLDRDVTVSVTAGSSQPLRIEDFLPAAQGKLAFDGVAALANQDVPAGDRPGLETGTLVATAAGAVPVETLRPGAVVTTEAGARAVVQSVSKRESVTLGAMSAVRLRAPYFGLARDLCVSRHTRLMLSGPEVEYTFGVEQVMAMAGDLVNGTSVLRDLTSPLREFHEVSLDRPGCVMSGRCRLAGADTGDAPAEVIDRRGAQALLSMRSDPRALIG